MPIIVNILYFKHIFKIHFHSQQAAQLLSIHFLVVMSNAMVKSIY